LGFFSTKSQLTDGERADCLRYLEEEEKLQVFRTKENDLCNAVLSENSQSRSSDSQATNYQRIVNRALPIVKQTKKYIGQPSDL